MTNETKSPYQLHRLADLIEEEIFNLADEDVIGDVIQEFGDLAAFEDKMQNIFECVLNEQSSNLTKESQPIVSETAPREITEVKMAFPRRWGEQISSENVIRLGEFSLYGMVSRTVQQMNPYNFATGQALSADGVNERPSDWLAGVQMVLSEGFSPDVLKKELPWLGNQLNLVSVPAEQGSSAQVIVAYVDVNESGVDRGRLLLALRDRGGRKVLATLCKAQPSAIFVGDVLDSDWRKYVLDAAIGRCA